MARTSSRTQYPAVRLFQLSALFPYSFLLGHVLCIDCCNNIVEKTSPRLSPVCPFCRVQFNSDSIRVIRLDFTTSGWSTPRRFPAMESLNDTFNTEVFQKRTERLIHEGASSGQLRVRRLEERVARIAAKKCSVEEVSSLYKELEDFLVAEKDDQVRNSVFRSTSDSSVASHSPRRFPSAPRFSAPF